MKSVALIIILVTVGVVIYFTMFTSKPSPEKFYSDKIQLDLLKAVSKHDDAKVKSLISEGADVDKVGNEGMTPLVWALAHLDKEGLKILLENGANPNFVDLKSKDDLPAMYLAAGAKDSDFLKILLEHKGDPNLIINTSLYTPIFIATEQKREENVKLLVKYGANINAQTEVGFTPTLHNAMGDDWVFTLFLLEQGADPTIPTNLGITLAYVASQSRVRPESRDGQALAQVLEMLKARGIKFPPATPNEVKAKMEAR